MADSSAYTSKSATLSGTTVDHVTITGVWSVIEIVNLDTTNALYVIVDKVAKTPSAQGDNCLVVPPSAARGVAVLYSPAVVSIIGSGGSYSVAGLNP